MFTAKIHYYYLMNNIRYNLPINQVVRSPLLYLRSMIRRIGELDQMYASCLAPGYLAFTFSIFKSGSQI